MMIVTNIVYIVYLLVLRSVSSIEVIQDEELLKQKTALITGITGQDGSYLAKFLLDLDYKVVGIIRRSSSFNTQRIDDLLENKNLKLRYGDITDGAFLVGLMIEIKPDEVYNLAAQSHVKVSFENPIYTADAVGLGALNLLNAIKLSGLVKVTKYYQASSSELYGDTIEAPQDEETKFSPQSPYAVSKLFAYWMTINYRKSYGIHASNGILFNHESPRRGRTFVTRKISMAVAKIKEGLQEFVELGNLDAERDWGHAKDYVEGMWMLLQHKDPMEIVLATGKTYKVRKFVEEAFKNININILWEGKGKNEIGYVEEKDKDGNIKKRIYVKVNEAYYRPSEVNLLLGNALKAKNTLGWEPKIGFEQLVKEMVEADIELLKNNPSSTI